MTHPPDPTPLPWYRHRLGQAWEFGAFFIHRFGEAEAMEAAAAIAYYAVFSLFPLLLLFVALQSSFLKWGGLEKHILEAAQQFFPGSRTLVEENLAQLVKSRGTIGLVGLLALAWSATGVFAGIAQNVNQAWKAAPPRHFLVDRLLALSMISSLGVLMICSIAISATLQILPQGLSNPANPLDGPSRFAMLFALKSVSTILLLVAFTLLYKLVPNIPVRWTEALAGAGCATIAWEITRSGFLLYLGSGWNSYQVVYGSLSAVVAFLLWIYISNLIILAGAHLSAAIAHFRADHSGPNGHLDRKGQPNPEAPSEGAPAGTTTPEPSTQTDLEPTSREPTEAKKTEPTPRNPVEAMEAGGIPHDTTRGKGSEPTPRDPVEVKGTEPMPEETARAKNAESTHLGQTSGPNSDPTSDDPTPRRGD